MRDMKKLEHDDKSVPPYSTRCTEVKTPEERLKEFNQMYKLFGRPEVGKRLKTLKITSSAI